MPLTYDNFKQMLEAEDDLDRLLPRQDMPHVIEVGENSDYWVFVNRKSKGIELIDKSTGDITRCSSFNEAVDKHGISQGQIRAAQDTLKMWPLEEN